MEKIKIDKNDLRNEILQLKNKIKALVNRKEKIAIAPVKFDLINNIYCFKVKVKNLLGNYSICNLLMRKKINGILCILLEEENGDEFEIEMSKIVKLQRIEMVTCAIMYKTVFQRKVTVDFEKKEKRKEFIDMMIKALKILGLEDNAINKML